jgi:hypothetical protein
MTCYDYGALRLGMETISPKGGYCRNDDDKEWKAVNYRSLYCCASLQNGVNEHEISKDYTLFGAYTKY